MNALLHDIVAEATESGSMSSSDWYKGIGLSIFVSVITGASKLAIRKSWLIQHEQEALLENEEGQPETQATFSGYLLSNDAESGGEELLMNHHLHAQSHPGVKNGYCFDSLVVNSGKKDRWCCCRRANCWNPRALRYAGMFGMTVLNPLCSVVAMNYASPSILAPFSGLALVWVILGAGVYLGEPPSKPQIIATLLIVIGEVVVAVFGDHTNDSGVTVEEVAKSYASPETISYFSCLAAYMLFLWYLIAKSNCPKWQRFAWGSCGGAITGPQNFIKDSLTTLKAVTSTPGVKIPWFFPLLIVLACLTAFVGLLLFTAAMKRYNATYCAAAYVGSYVMSASINSIMHYHTFASLPGTWNDIMYPFGLFVLMLGVYLLEATGEEDDDDDYDEEELNVDDEIEYLLDGITTTMQSQDLIIEKALQDCKEVFAYVQLDMEEEEKTLEEEADEIFDEEIR